jgi:hypothetical protein
MDISRSSAKSPTSSTGGQRQQVPLRGIGQLEGGPLGPPWPRYATARSSPRAVPGRPDRGSPRRRGSSGRGGSAGVAGVWSVPAAGSPSRRGPPPASMPVRGGEATACDGPAPRARTPGGSGRPARDGPGPGTRRRSGPTGGPVGVRHPGGRARRGVDRGPPRFEGRVEYVARRDRRGDGRGGRRGGRVPRGAPAPRVASRSDRPVSGAGTASTGDGADATASPRAPGRDARAPTSAAVASAPAARAAPIQSLRRGGADSASGGAGAGGRPRGRPRDLVLRAGRRAASRRRRADGGRVGEVGPQGVQHDRLAPGGASSSGSRLFKSPAMRKRARQPEQRPRRPPVERRHLHATAAGRTGQDDRLGGPGRSG